MSNTEWVVQQVPFVLWAPLAWSWAFLWYCLARRVTRRLFR